MSVTIAWAKGGEARVLALETDSARLWSSIPSPPGSRIEGRLTAEGAPSETIKFKIHVCQAAPEGGYVLQGRPLDLRREVREAITSRLA